MVHWQLCASRVSAEISRAISLTPCSHALSSTGRYCLRPVSARASDLDGLPIFICLVDMRLRSEQMYEDLPV
jgi:hypothetical protein